MIVEILSDWDPSAPNVDLLILKNEVAHAVPPGFSYKWILGKGDRIRHHLPRLTAELFRATRNYGTIVIGQEGHWPFSLFPLVLGRRAVTIVHSPLTLFLRNKSPLLRRLRPLVGWLYRRYDVIVAVSHGVRDDLIENFGIDPGKVACIPNGIRLTARPEGPNVHSGHPAPGVRLLSVGRLSPEKNFGFLLDVFARLLARSRRSDISLTICGDGPDLGALRNKASVLGVGDRVSFLGFVNGIDRVYAGSTIYVHAALWEGFGMSILEAMRHALPVVTSKSAGSIDMLEGSPLVIAEHDAEKYCETLMRLVDDAEYRARMAAFSASRALRFDIRTTRKLYAELFRETMEGSDRTR